MNKLNALILLMFIEGAAAADAVVAYSDKLDVLQVLIENAITVNHHEPNEPNVQPLLAKSKQTRFSVAHTRIAALPDSLVSKEKPDLEKMLLQFNELKIPSSRTQQKDAGEAAPPEPNIVKSQPQESNTVPPGQIDKKTIEELVALAKDPNAIAEPLALAQTLYRTGYFKEAAIFYEIAADRTTAMGRTLSSDDKAWILLQLAVCHQDAPATAIGVLDKLIAEYPKSIWTSAAVTKRDILQWYQNDNPRQLLETPR
jgi:hypothetical protein